METSKASPEPQAAASRVDWVDYAKGICIVWVVTLYSTEFVRLHAGEIGWMEYAVDFAQPFRMPDFFMLSALFVGRALNKPWRAYLDSRVLHFAYFYLLWGTLKFINMEGDALFGPDIWRLIPAYLWMLVEPPTGPLWFLYILALFSLAVRLVKSWPPLLVLSIAAIMQLAVADTEIAFKLGDKFCRYFVFFYIGYLCSPLLFRVTDWARTRPRTTLALFFAWCGWNGTLVVLQHTHLPGMQLAMGCIGAVAIMLIASWLAQRHWAGALRYLGRNSIVVYLGFVVPLGLMRRFIVSSSASGVDGGSVALLVTVLSVAGALGLYYAVRRTPLRFLFERPAWCTLPGVRVREGESRAAAPVPAVPGSS